MTDGSPTADALPRPGRFRRALIRVGAALGLGLVAVGSAVTGAILHLDLPVTRRIARDVTNDALAKVFQGRIVAGEIDHVGLDGVSVRSAVVLDPRGRQAIRASGIRARVDVIHLARVALSGGPEIRIELPFIRIEHADVLVEIGPAGKVTLEETFQTRPPVTPPKPPTPGTAPPRPVRVILSRVEIGHTWAHGMIAPPRALDADVTRLAASIQVGPEGVAVDAAPCGIVDRGLLPAPVAGTADYHLRVNPAAPKPRMWTSFAGRFGEVEVIARADIDGDHLSAIGDVPRASPAELATVLPGFVVTEPITAAVGLSGQIPRFDVEAKVGVHELASTDARGEVSVFGGLDASGPVRLALDFEARDVDPALFGPPLAPIAGARVEASGRFVAVVNDDGPFVEIGARTGKTSVRGQRVPAAEAHVVLHRGRVWGDVTLDEPGMDVASSFDLDTDGFLRFDARARVPRVAAAPRIAGHVDGSVTVHTRGALARGRLDADVTMSVGGLRAPGDVEMESGTIRGKLFGPLDELQVDAILDGSGMRAGGYDFESVKARARGPVASPRIQSNLVDPAGGKVAAEGNLDALAGVVRDLTVEVERDDEKVKGKIARVGAVGGAIAVEGVSLSGEGVGKLSGDLRVQGNDVTGKLKGEGVDLARVARLVGFPFTVKGLANIDVSLSRGKKGRSGHVMIELENGELPLLPGLSANVTAKFEEDAVQADGLVRLVATPPPGAPTTGPGAACNGTIASVRFSKGDGKLVGPLLSAGTWASMTGSVEVAAERWDIACLERLSPVRAPLSELKGTATTRFKVERPTGQRFPSVRDFTFHTNGFVIAGPQDMHEERPSWESRNIDVALKGSLEGDTGKTNAALTLFDGQILSDLTASADLDLARLWDRPAERRSAIEAAPVTVRLSVPRRPVRGFVSLPTFVLPYLPTLSGDVRIDGYADGTLREPFIAVRAMGWGLALAEDRAAKRPSEWALPLDLDAIITYDDDKVSLAANASHAGREIAHASAELVTDLPALIAPRPGDKPTWTGGFLVKLDGVPIGEVPRFGDADVTGRLGGTITATRLNERPTLSVDLGVQDLKVGDDRFDSASIKLQVQRAAEEGKDTGIATVNLREKLGGRLDATAYAGIRWIDRVVPTFDLEERADLHAHAEGFRLAALHPLVSDVLSKLDGRLDGDVRVGWGRLSQGLEQGSVYVKMQVKDGAFHVPQIGQEFKDTTVRITTDPPAHLGDKTTIGLHDLRAVGISGELKGSGKAIFDGLRFETASGEVRIDQKNKLPITLEGVPLGRAYGSVSVSAENPRTNEVLVDVVVNKLHLDLPATPAKAVQPLEDHPEIAISHARGPKKEPRSADALTWRTKVTLKEVKLAGAGVDLTLKTRKPMEIVLSDKARIEGDIQIDNGRVDVFGKTFDVQPGGLVRMRPEDTSNPYLSVSAHYPGDGIEIDVDYQGTLKPITKDKLRFRSTPACPDDRLMLVLLGSDWRDPEVCGGGQSDTADGGGGLGASLGGNVAAGQLNQLLSGTFLRGVSTRVGPSEEGNLKTSVAYQIGDTVTALASYEQTNQGGAAGGAGTTTDATGRTQLEIDWRFHRNWSVNARVGNDTSVQGEASGLTSGVDLLWQYRY